MTRRISATIVMIVGLVFVGVTIAARLFTVGPAFERMTKEFRPVMQSSHLQAMRGDIAQLSAGVQEFKTKLLPMYAAKVGVSPADGAAQLGTAFPNVTKGLQATPAIASQFDGVVATLAGEQTRFARADSIPTTSMPATTVPWGLFGAGVVLFGVGAIMLRPGFTAAWVGAIFAVLLMVVPLALSLPGKAAAADKMNAHLKPVYTAQMVSGAEASLNTIKAMANEMQTKALPVFARQFGMTPAQLQQTLGQVAPNLAKAMATMPAALTRFTTTVSAFKAELSDYTTLKPVELLPIVWVLFAGGAVTLLAAVALVAERRPRPAIVHYETPKAA